MNNVFTRTVRKMGHSEVWRRVHRELGMVTMRGASTSKKCVDGGKTLLNNVDEFIYSSVVLYFLPCNVVAKN